MKRTIGALLIVLTMFLAGMGRAHGATPTKPDPATLLRPMSFAGVKSACSPYGKIPCVQVSASYVNGLVDGTVAPYNIPPGWVIYEVEGVYDYHYSRWIWWNSGYCRYGSLTATHQINRCRMRIVLSCGDVAYGVFGYVQLYWYPEHDAGVTVGVKPFPF